MTSGSNERIERAIVDCSSGTCSISSQSGSWLNGTPSRSGAGLYTVAINSGVFSATPTCAFTALSPNTSQRFAFAINYSSWSSTSVQVNTANSSTTNTDSAFGVVCIGPH